jgi:hypothetical protein
MDDNTPCHLFLAILLINSAFAGWGRVKIVTPTPSEAFSVSDFATGREISMVQAKSEIDSLADAMASMTSFLIRH